MCGQQEKNRYMQQERCGMWMNIIAGEFGLMIHWLSKTARKWRVCQIQEMITNALNASCAFALRPLAWL